MVLSVIDPATIHALTPYKRSYSEQTLAHVEVLDALAAGFATTVITDATRAISAEGWEAARADLAQHGGHLVASLDL